MANIIMTVLGAQQWIFHLVYGVVSAIGLRWVADLASCFAAKSLRLFAGGFATKSKLPLKAIQLYQYEGAYCIWPGPSPVLRYWCRCQRRGSNFECCIPNHSSRFSSIAWASVGVVRSGCPFCRKVGEAASALSLEVDVFPTPRETLKRYGVIKDSRFRGKVEEIGKKAMFPFMVDPNTGTSMYESAAIVEYLWDRYGDAPTAPWFVSNVGATWNSVLLGLVTLFRPLFSMGILRVPSRAPELPLELWGAEGFVDSRPAQESLCSLELPYRFHTVPIGAPMAKWEALAAAGGSFWKLPLLIDPNAGHKKVVGGTAIAQYLEATYKTGESVAETAADYSTAGASADHGTVPGASADKSA